MNNGRLIAAMQAKYDELLMERDELRNEVNGWSAWASTSRCIYCEEVFTHDPIKQEEADELKKAHVLVCPNHPYGKALALLARTSALIAEPPDAFEEWMWLADEINTVLRSNMAVTGRRSGSLLG
jgi:hypothetical protein